MTKLSATPWFGRRKGGRDASSDPHWILGWTGTADPEARPFAAAMIARDAAGAAQRASGPGDRVCVPKRPAVLSRGRYNGGMSIVLTPLRELGALDAALAAAGERPTLIFKHSLTCGTSAWALEEVEAALDACAGPLEAYLVPVQTARPVSNAIAERLGLRHESPQALVLASGRVVWSASHHGLTAQAIAGALARALPPASTPVV
jgi:bacillithiol system protein YtxJ